MLLKRAFGDFIALVFYSEKYNLVDFKLLLFILILTKVDSCISYSAYIRLLDYGYLLKSVNKFMFITKLL